MSWLEKTEPWKPNCAMWPPCGGHPDPHACCRKKPLTCYDQDCSRRRYIGNARPVFTLPPGATYYGDLRSPPRGDHWFYRDNDALLPQCRQWPACKDHPSPRLCCANKPPGCDLGCHALGWGIRDPVFVNVNTVGGHAGHADGECSAFPPCSAQSNPQLCCASKRPGCDPSCPMPTFRAKFRGNTFVDEDDDDLFGVDD